MPEFVTLSCPSCGAKLQISNDLERFACAHCGNEHVVKRDGGVISLTPVVEQLKEIRTGVDKTASELAIKRIREEINDLQRKADDIKGAGCLAAIFSGNGLMYILGAGFIIILAIGNLHDESAANALKLFLFFAVLAIIGLGVFDFYSEKEASEKRVAIQKNISEKQTELEKHTKIVSNY